MDLSRPMLDRARRLSEEEGIPNVNFELADAQVHPIRAEATSPSGISRFGTMFFTDPVAAFTNIGRALRPGARLVQLVWQAHDRQEWTRRHPASADRQRQPEARRLGSPMPPSRWRTRPSRPVC